jgi:hypothetical protein
MGLSPEHRRKLLAPVAERETANEATGLERPQELYNFQLSSAADDNDGVAVIVAVEQIRQENTKIRSIFKRSDNSISYGERQLNKFRSRMEKAPGKFMD